MNSKHIVAIFGGAVSGAEAAYQLAQRGISSVVFEQNALPYGKIEDGLPKWHVKLRDQEEEKINRKLSHPLVHYVPNTVLGKDIDLENIAKNWGFSAVLLATGAWKDRPLPIENIDNYINRGLYYQNSFVYWFNHFHEPNYSHQQYEIPDETIVIGGGLASLDVVKILMFQTVEKALKKCGHKVNLFDLDVSIAKVLSKLNLTLEDLKIKGCSLYYRRRIQDMPLSPTIPNTYEQLLKTQKLREKILDNYQRKYLFNVYPHYTPVDKIIENDRLAGIVFQKTKVENGKVIPLPDSRKVIKAPLVIASIGSIPQHIKGIPIEGQVYKVFEEDCFRVEGYNNVFALGNAVTGRGNIKDSMRHSSETIKKLAEKYLTEDTTQEKAIYEKEFERIHQQTQEIVMNLSNRLHNIITPSENKQKNLIKRINDLQKKQKYQGDFMDWIKKHLPIRLENILFS